MSSYKIKESMGSVISYARGLLEGKNKYSATFGKYELVSAKKIKTNHLEEKTEESSLNEQIFLSNTI